MAIAELVKLWVAVRPIHLLKKRRARRRAEKMAETITLTTPTGETIEHTPPMIPLRTATKAAAGSVLLGFPALEVVQQIQAIDFPWPWLESFTNSQAFVWLCATIVPIIIARFTKSPLAKQTL